MTQGFEGTFECPKCPYVAPNWAQLKHHMVTSTTHGRAKIGESDSTKPRGRGRPKKNTELEKKGEFRSDYFFLKVEKV